MYNSIREITPTNIDSRVETGPTRIGKDHCGLFIRGDNCFGYALALEAILTQREDRVDPLHIHTLQELLEHLQSTNEGLRRLVENQMNDRIPGLKQMTDEQLAQEIANRRSMLDQMVGNLYPAILADEITIIEREIGNRAERDQLN